MKSSGMGERHHEGVVPDPGDNSDSYVQVPSPLLSVSSIQTESMGRDAVMECAGVTSPVPAEGGQDPLFMEGQRRLRENAEFSEPSSTEDWVRQAMVAMKMAPCKYKLQTGSINSIKWGGGRWGHEFRIEKYQFFNISMYRQLNVENNCEHLFENYAIVVWP